MKYLVLLIILISIGIISLVVYRYINSNNNPKPTVSTPKVTDNPTKEYNFENETLLENLNTVWSIGFINDSEFLFTEREGLVYMFNTDNRKLNGPLVSLDVNTQLQGEGGLLGLAIHPDFEKNKFVYLYYTYRSTNIYNKVSRFELVDDKLINEKTIIDQIPANRFHNGGRLLFDANKKLYITTGDAQNTSLSQDTDSVAGKILRINDDGTNPTDNPFNNQIFSYGHRNPQGLTFDDLGNLWSTEHGNNTKDELNRIEIGKNYGWPIIQGNQTKQDMITPVINSGSDTWAPSDAAFLDGSIYFGGLRGQALFQAILNSERTNVIELKTHYKNRFGRIRSVTLGPDNLLYISTSNRDGRGQVNNSDDKIIRVNPKLLP